MIRSDRTILLATIVVGLVALTAIFLLARRQPAAGGDVADSLAATVYGRHGADARGRGDYGTRRSQRPVVYNDAPVRHPETFPFDPNTADSTQLLRLGLQPWQVRNIYHYRAAGGVYQRKEDFARLYGLTVKDYRRLEPYIRIGADYQPAATLLTATAARRPAADSVAPSAKLRDGEHVVLNTADTAELRRVPGIGAYYAREIMRYGQRLGGYVSVDQLDEIDDFPAESKRFFVVSQPSPQRLNVNRLTLQQLRRHPYINFYQAKAIVDYRRLRGPISSLHDLHLSADFPPEAISRLEPYVEY